MKTEEELWRQYCGFHHEQNKSLWSMLRGGFSRAFAEHDNEVITLAKQTAFFRDKNIIHLNLDEFRKELKVVR